jgi:hypothetical protein
MRLAKVEDISEDISKVEKEKTSRKWRMIRRPQAGRRRLAHPKGGLRRRLRRLSPGGMRILSRPPGWPTTALRAVRDPLIHLTGFPVHFLKVNGLH